MVGTSEMFLWATALTYAILLAFLIPMVIELFQIRGDIKPISAFVNDIDKFFRVRGLTDLTKTLPKSKAPEHHSLPVDKAAERDNLTRLRQTRGLTDFEANRLKALLQEDANDDLAKGVIGILAFVAIIAIINAISSRSKG
jgi:hypothetical protein